MVDSEFLLLGLKEVNGSTLPFAGEEFLYHVEQSDNLRTWSKSGLMLENSIDIGGGMMRQVWVTSQVCQLKERDIFALELQLHRIRDLYYFQPKYLAFTIG